ncbi:MAG: hypothetical protein MZV63_62475 [Marinilabiliales bacterium]|nr:hypothetical protein [Marinilabiliales bacterium]
MSQITVRHYSAGDFTGIMELWTATGLSRPERGDDEETVERSIRTGRSHACHVRREYRWQHNRHLLDDLRRQTHPSASLRDNPGIPGKRPLRDAAEGITKVRQGKGIPGKTRGSQNKQKGIATV